MRPPYSMIFFTTLAGAAQGLFLALFAADVAVATGALDLSAYPFMVGAAMVLVLSAAGLVAAVFHLGRPLRAWRSMAMWRTSWLSREVILLPIFMATVFAWGLAHALQWPTWGLGLLGAVLALGLYLCTGMIYAAVHAIRQWAHPVTPLNYLVLGLASGFVLAAALAAWAAPELLKVYVQAALLTTLLGAATRGWALWRNLSLVPKTTLQTAIGVRHPKIQQKSQGLMGGSFNTREFFHGRTPQAVRSIRWAAGLLGFVVPVALLLLAAASASPLVWLVLAFLLQYVGLLAERWSFFAEGQHTQNLYYQTVG